MYSLSDQSQAFQMVEMGNRHTNLEMCMSCNNIFSTTTKYLLTATTKSTLYRSYQPVVTINSFSFSRLQMNPKVYFMHTPVYHGLTLGNLYSVEYGIAELRNKRKSHSKLFAIVYSLYNILIYIPHLVENTITVAPILRAIFK